MRCGMQAIGLALVLWLAGGIAMAAPDFPKLTGRVVDQADMISAPAEQRVSHLLAGLEKANGDQLVVVTIPDLGDTTIENYGYQLGRAWGIGDKDSDNGALVLIAKKQHRIRIEVGYGLEGQLTDARSALIIRRIIQPAFKAGDFDRGVIQGTAAIIDTLGVDPSGIDQTLDSHENKDTAHSSRPSIGHVLFFVVLMIAITGLFGSGGGGGGSGRRRRRGRRLPWFIPMGGGLGGSGGSFGGGGGFSGGGGGFGGGGASGGW